MIVRPRGRSEAVWTVLGALACLALGLVTPRNVVEVTLAGKGALLFLLALILLSALVEASGFFEWAAIEAARRARGDGRALYRNVFLLGAAVTVALSLDTTAVMLTPLVLAFLARLGFPARPWVLACAFVSNTASLLLPISNLTNLLFAERFDLGFARFAARMACRRSPPSRPPTGCSACGSRASIPPRFNEVALGRSGAAVAHRGYFRAATAVLALVFAGYFLAPLAGVAPYAVAFAGAAVLAVYGLRTGRVELRMLRGLWWCAPS